MNPNLINTGSKNKQKAKLAPKTNVLESLKDLTGGVPRSIKEDLLAPMGKDFFNQLIRSRVENKKFSGELHPGEEVGMRDVFSGQREKEEKLARQITMERSLQEEERSLFERKLQELRIQLQAIMQEMQTVAEATPKLAQELQIAAVQAPVSPGIYHIRFFEKLFEFIKAFRKNANDATNWLHAVNARGKKGGNVWGENYKKSKGKYLLSSEHYLQRSAG